MHSGCVSFSGPTSIDVDEESDDEPEPIVDRVQPDPDAPMPVRTHLALFEQPALMDSDWMKRRMNNTAIN